MLKICKFTRFLKLSVHSSSTHHVRSISYVQGQSQEPKTREYFYFIDHEGLLFLDDARMKNFTSCFKDKKFLKFFFDRLRPNQTDRYRKDFPFLSVCGRERNYIRCDDVPIVYTNVLANDTALGSTEKLCYAHAGDLLTADFEPTRIYMSPVTGRVYHPAEEKQGGIGLIRSKLAIEFSKHFEFDGNDDDEVELDGSLRAPSRFVWNGQVHQLDSGWAQHCRVKSL